MICCSLLLYICNYKQIFYSNTYYLVKLFTKYSSIWKSHYINYYLFKYFCRIVNIIVITFKTEGEIETFI